MACDDRTFVPGEDRTPGISIRVGVRFVPLYEMVAANKVGAGGASSAARGGAAEFHVESFVDVFEAVVFAIDHGFERVKVERASADSILFNIRAV